MYKRQAIQATASLSTGYMCGWMRMVKRSNSTTSPTIIESLPLHIGDIDSSLNTSHYIGDNGVKNTSLNAPNGTFLAEFAFWQYIGNAQPRFYGKLYIGYSTSYIQCDLWMVA